MKNNSLCGIACFCLVAIVCQLVLTLKANTPIRAMIDIEQIRNTTVLIAIESHRPSGVIIARGMGTLVRYAGDALLVTHNHWGDFLQDENIVDFFNAENHLLTRCFVFELKRTILFQDAGTLVLKAPDKIVGFMGLASLRQNLNLMRGTRVQITYRQHSSDDRLSVRQALVVEIKNDQEAPVYKLRSLDGQALQPGDSGGGVWYAGQFIGNNWAVITTSLKDDTNGAGDLLSKNDTDLSYAAIFPWNIQ